MPLKQHRFEIISAENSFQAARESLRSNTAQKGSWITSKEAQRRYREKTRGPKLSKAEQRKIELEEQARIRKEFEQDKSRAARERKKAKDLGRAQKQRDERKKKGLPLVDVRPSQETLARFFSKPVAGKKRDNRGVPLDTIVEDQENQEPEQQDSEPNSHLPTPKRQKTELLPQCTPQSAKPSQLDYFGDDDNDVDWMAELQLITEANAAAKDHHKQSPPQRTRPNLRSRRPGLVCLQPLQTSKHKVTALATSDTTSQPRFLPKHLQTPQSLTQPKSPSRVRSLDNDAVPPTSTQLFMLNHFDDFFPTPSQEKKELEDANTAQPPALPFFSTQDFLLSSQDLIELEKTPNTPSKARRNKQSQKHINPIILAQPAGSQDGDDDVTLGRSQAAGLEEPLVPPAKQRFFTSSGTKAMEAMVDLRAKKLSLRTFRDKEQKRQYQQPVEDDDHQYHTEAAKPVTQVRRSQRQASQHQPFINKNKTTTNGQSQETNYGSFDLGDVQDLDLHGQETDYIDEDDGLWEGFL